MKHFIMLLLVAIGFQLRSQTHHIGLTFGLNQSYSPELQRELRFTSPFSSKIGTGVQLDYNYVYENSFLIGAYLNRASVDFVDEDEEYYFDNQYRGEYSDLLLKLRFISSGVYIGYEWNVTRNYGLRVSGGPAFFYRYEELAYFRDFQDKERRLRFEPTNENVYYAIDFSLDQTYTVMRELNYRFKIKASIRNSYVFNFLDYGNQNNRILPQAYLGVELELGRRRR